MADKTLEEVILRVVDARIASTVQTTFPGKIVSTKYYTTKQQVDVQPLILLQYPDGEQLKLGVTYNVPVKLLGSSQGGFTVPLVVGDLVELTYCKRSLEELVEGAYTDPYLPADSREFSLTDCTAFPCIPTVNINLSPSKTNLEIKFGGNTISLKPNGAITANGATITSSGNVVTKSGTDLDALKADLAQFKIKYNLHGVGSTGHPPTPPA